MQEAQERGAVPSRGFVEIGSALYEQAFKHHSMAAIEDSRISQS